MEARRRVSATPMAAKAPDPAPGPPLSQGGALADYNKPAADRGKLIPRSLPLKRRSSADVDVRGIRAGLRMTQAEFAGAFGVLVATLRDWEQGRAAPDMAARTLLRVIEFRPEAVRGALARICQGTGKP